MIVGTTQCKSCEGVGWIYTGVEHSDLKQTQDCPDCDGEGLFKVHTNLCGICNEEVPIEHAANHFIESDKSLTSYHFGCGKMPEPCVDCGHRRKFCNDCKE